MILGNCKKKWQRQSSLLLFYLVVIVLVDSCQLSFGFINSRLRLWDGVVKTAPQIGLGGAADDRTVLII